MIYSLQKIYEYVRTEISQASQLGFVSQTDVDFWANEGYRKYISRLRRFDEGFFEKFHTFDIDASANGLIELPSTFSGVTLLEKKVNSTDYVPLTYKKRDEPTGDSVLTGSGYLPYYSFLGNYLLLEPNPQTDETDALRMKMKYIPPDLHRGTVVLSTSTSITLASDADPRDDYYNGTQIMITSGTGIGQIRTISDYDGDTKIATISVAWDTNPDTVSEYSTLIDVNFPSEFQMLIPLYASKKAFAKERSRGAQATYDSSILKELERDFTNTFESRSDGRRFVEPFDIF